MSDARIGGDEQDPTSPGPFSVMLGFQLVERGPEGVVIEATPAPEHANGGGIPHRGYLPLLPASRTGWAVHSALEHDRPAPHTHLSVQYIRAGLVGKPLVCRGRCVKAGRTVCAAEAEITQDGKVIARAVSSHAVMGGG